MAMGTGGAQGGLNAEMNVTPLIDVLLVLLVIFMVVVPLSQMGYDIQIPKETQSQVPQQQQEKQIILAVNESSCNILQPLAGAGRRQPARCASTRRRSGSPTPEPQDRRDLRTPPEPPPSVGVKLHVVLFE